MTNDITIRYATDADYDALLPMLDQAFGFPSERTNGFEELLPKLYHPEMTQLLAVKNGEIVGAVGLFERKINVCGEILTTVGIGNVACRSDLRGEGIMSALMRKATADIIASGADLSDLGGRRHRYAHFGYECAGRVCSFTVRSDFKAHTGFVSSALACVPIEPYLADAEAMYCAKPVHFVRDDFDAVTRSWCADRYAFTKENGFAGYAIVDRGRVTEMMLADPSHLPDAASALFDATGEKSLTFTLHETDLLVTFMQPIYDGVNLRTNEQISVLNFKKTVAAYAKCAATMHRLPDLVLPLHICGVAGDERFTVSVTDSCVSVTDDAEDPITLSHRDAISFLFGLVSTQRNAIPCLEELLPLPLYFSSPDCV